MSPPRITKSLITYIGTVCIFVGFDAYKGWYYADQEKRGHEWNRLRTLKNLAYIRGESKQALTVLLIGTYLSSRYCEMVLSKSFWRLKDDIRFILYFYLMACVNVLSVSDNWILLQ